MDWDWGASGAGEIDLAALTEGWPDDVRSASLAAYTEGRWPEGAPYDVARMVTRARLYLHARWLGGRPDRRDDPEAAEYLETTAEIASQLGALG